MKGKVPQRPKVTEAMVQRSIVEYLRLRNILFFSVLNELAGGGKQAQIRMKKAVGMGLLAGVSDLVVVLENAVIFMEVKSESGRQSKNQRWFQSVVERLGHTYVVVRNVADVERVLDGKVR
jgi:hypothetical protein